MKNKKGFTLIELLAVIVILAIIMVIAVPQILNVINDSRESSWKNSVRMVKNAIEVNTTLYNPSGNNSQYYKISTLCTAATGKTIDDNFKEIVDLGDLSVNCNGTGEHRNVILTGKNQFSGKTATLDCDTKGTQVNCKLPSGY